MTDESMMLQLSWTGYRGATVTVFGVTTTKTNVERRSNLLWLGRAISMIFKKSRGRKEGETKLTSGIPPCIGSSLGQALILTMNKYGLVKPAEP